VTVTGQFVHKSQKRTTKGRKKKREAKKPNAHVKRHWGDPSIFGGAKVVTREFVIGGGDGRGASK